MTTMTTPTKQRDSMEAEAVDQARLLLYRLLSLALSDPRSNRRARLLDRGFQDCVSAAAVFLAEEPAACGGSLAPGELPAESLSAVDQLIQFARRPLPEAVDDYDRTFGLVVSKKCPPYESEFCPETFSVYRAQHLADVAGFYSAFGLQPSRDLPERHDHLALELEFMAWLIAKERHATESGSEDAMNRAEICREAQRTFFKEHLAWWAPAFAFALARRVERMGKWEEMAGAPLRFYGAVGRVLAAFVAAERAILDVPAPTRLVAPQPADDTEPNNCEGCGIPGW
jgi:TorA maturation chaperone TorD